MFRPGVGALCVLLVTGEQIYKRDVAGAAAAASDVSVSLGDVPLKRLPLGGALSGFLSELFEAYFSDEEVGGGLASIVDL
ncbi:MAG: hypothetical protein HRU17_12515 [Polyangiaceae bacterium]|nr:hypothetical protein [Polyangiaceae bacterium]